MADAFSIRFDSLRMIAVMEAVIEGLALAQLRLNITVGIIVCGLRDKDPSVTAALAGTPSAIIIISERRVVALSFASLTREIHDRPNLSPMLALSIRS